MRHRRPLTPIRTFPILAITIVIGCGNSKSPTTSAGPVYTPGLQYAIHALAPDCLVARTETSKTYTCRGARGNATVEVTPDDRLIHIHLQLVRMELFNAKVLLEPPLTPIIGKATVDAMEVELAKLQHAEHGALDSGGVHVALFAGGTNLREPEYEVDVTW